MSTLTKYRFVPGGYGLDLSFQALLCRLMREPKPFIVGISWVVECAEQCRRVGEENFLVDLEGLNIAGTNKVSVKFVGIPWGVPYRAHPTQRRRSMLPKHISSSIQAHMMAPPSLLGPTLTGTLASDQSMDGSSGEISPSPTRQLIILLLSLVGADRSLNSSDGVVEDEDDLPPLERARQRRNLLFRS